MLERPSKNSAQASPLAMSGAERERSRHTHEFFVKKFERRASSVVQLNRLRRFGRLYVFLIFVVSPNVRCPNLFSSYSLWAPTAKRLCIYRGGRRANAKTWYMADAFTKPKPRRTTMKPDRYDPIAAALKEDIGAGDITTDLFVPETLHTSGRIIAREKAIVAGTGVCGQVFRQVH